ncbi:PREDICTED: leucine-rich repeat and transmembrane domain-containing protein 2 isoform X1 [Drosophila arizonae]|uniref:Leucine-rich repeat and transmembrane domain-containing protein 2 isoform X1 n=1 Tax=Drosophila arizonae TaxID=7263 RepID=A0ABM1P6J9_DROAR|nr:PREDICTED: leucine-rich repeat and transmembrane domain-containing protein 2 isoform X1 [Drosophila arizonae]XP_017862836.1 PREDICTED: leucine-rich repeat and transmembrane domain-containing protein 2 isoform X1 [Drosophila arizonae]
MHVYYKFGLFLIFLLSVSISQTAPADKSQKDSSNNNSVNNYYEYDDDDYADEVQSSESSDKLHPEIAANRQLGIASSTTTTTFRPIFSIPRRSSHVLEPSCPRHCLCLEDFKYVQCTNAHLTHVPLDLPKTAAIIDLSHNVISELRAEDFANLSKVVEINLNHNLIRRIDKEAFTGMERLRRLRLANNQLTKIDPDTFSSATDLALLDLSNNSIIQRTDGSFLNQPSLIEFSCSNCSWTELPEQIFTNMSGLNALRLDNNEFKRQINTRAFTPLKYIIKLKLPELDQPNIEELCNLLKSIDNISFKNFDVSCFELVLGTSFNDSLIQASSDPPFSRTTAAPSTPKPTTPAPPRTAANRNRNRVANETASVAKAGVMTESSSDKPTDKEEPYQVPISQETINILLICIMVVAVVGIIVGLICRKDLGGIKTKCCRTSKPEPKDQVHPTEEIPLNKLA